MANFIEVASMRSASLPNLDNDDSIYAKMVKNIWVQNATTNKAKKPNNVELFNKLQSGLIPKPQTAMEWQELAPIFPNFGMFALFMLMHRRIQSEKWGSFHNGFELLSHLADSSNYKLNPRWATASSVSGIIACANKSGPKYTGSDTWIKQFTDLMEVGCLGNTLFSSTKLLLGGANTPPLEGQIINLVPGFMTQRLDYLAMGFPPFETSTTPDTLMVVRERLAFYSNPSVDFTPFFIDESSVKTTSSPRSRKPTYKVDYSDLPDL